MSCQSRLPCGTDNNTLPCICRLLSEENLSACNLETLTATFHRQFAKHDSFRLLNGLVVLLQMRDLLPAPPQRLAAIFLLYEAYRADPSPNPFSLFFTELLQPSVRTDEGSGLSPVEEWFLCQLLATSIPRDVSPSVIGQHICLLIGQMCQCLLHV